MSLSKSYRVLILMGIFELVAVGNLPASDSVIVEPKVELLWPHGAPGALGDQETDKPTLTIYLPPEAKATGASVVICPGGGYWTLAMDHEGHQIAQWLNSFGVAGFIVKYRVAEHGYHYPAPLLDAQRAIRIVHARASEWKIDPNRIGIMGFSAGGHLAASVGTHFDAGNPNADNAIDRASSRPDFMILCYSVLLFNSPYSHGGSQINLLGKDADPKLVELFSNEKQVTADTPPTFLFHTTTDTAVPPENSIYFYLALRRANVPAELHIYEVGEHGVGLAPKDPILSSWSPRCVDWMKKHGWLEKK